MKKKWKLLILIPLCVLVLCAGALLIYNAVENAAIDRTGLQAYSYQGLRYRIYAPEDTGAGGKYPLLLYLHGAGRNGKNNRSQVKDNIFFETILSEDTLAKYPCIVLAPQCPKGKGWVRQPWGPGIAADLMGLLEEITATYPVDPARIYITGVSMGGFGTWGMLRYYPGYFAAAVPICGGWDLDDDVENAPVMKDVPIWAFHGTLDTAVPVARTSDMVDALKAVGGNVRYTEYPDEEHGIAGKVYSEPELLPWLFAQVKN
ncbi:MAG: prolyl oligopeptidase family serine peptidase [Oscillospiraceae bacterium]|nr:prolyl oligopeptidase family serine peptidase [Oscillospiraceae bacterium]